MKITVAVHGRWHAFELAGELHRRGHLDRLMTTYPRAAAHRFLPPGVALETAPSLELLRRISGKIPAFPAPDAFIARRFAAFAARHLPEDSEILVSWSSATLEAMEPAHRNGARVVLERGSTHIAHQRDVLTAEYQRLGLAPPVIDPRIVAREEAEYEQADAIALPTRFAAETFRKRGFAADKLLVNPYGVALDRFQPSPPGVGRPRILFAGRVGPRKGVPHLIEAFRPLAGDAELHLVGSLEAGMASWLAKEDLKGVALRGAVPGHAMAREFAAAQIFCLPSLEEGMALVLPQAMAAGLAIVATPESGAGDLIEDGREGRLVPAGDAGALGDALAGLVGDAETRGAMGAAARARVADGFTWDDYGTRAVTLYAKLLATGRAAHSSSRQGVTP